MDMQKLIEIETTLAHQDQQITDLNAVITDQWKDIDRLKRLLDKAMAKIERLEGGAGDVGEGDSMSLIDRARQDIPPHY